MLANLIYIVLPLLIIAKVYNRYRISNMTLEVSYKIKSCEYRLIVLGETNKNIKKQESYEYLSNLMDKVRCSLTDIYLAPLIYHIWRLKKGSITRNKDTERIEAQILKNDEMHSIYSDFMGTILTYMFAKSFTMHCLYHVNKFYNFIVNMLTDSKGDLPMQKLKKDMKNTFLTGDVPGMKLAH